MNTSSLLATTTLSRGARLDLFELDAIVGGAASVTSQKQNDDNLADIASQLTLAALPAELPTELAHAKPTLGAEDSPLARAELIVLGGLALALDALKHGSSYTPETMAPLELGIAMLGTAKGLEGTDASPEQVRALSLAITYDLITRCGGAGDATERAFLAALSNQVLAQPDELARGVALMTGFGSPLGDTLGRGMDVIADIAARAPANEREDALARAGAMFADGLERAHHTRMGNDVFAVMDDPKNVAAWQNLVEDGIASKAIGSMLPGTTAVNVMCKLVESGALAKLWGGSASDIPPEAKQVARSISGLVSDVKDTFIEVYKTGFIGSIEKVGGIFLHAAANLDALRQGVMSGDPAKMGAAIADLAKDALNDFKNVVTNFYVTAPTMVFQLGSKAIMNLLDNLGATKYAEIAVAACKEALTSFAADARAGIVGAANVIGDFAQRGLATAVHELSEIAKAAGHAAEEAARALGKAAHAVGDVARLAVNALGDLCYTQPLKIAQAAAGALADAGKAAGAYAAQAVETLRGVAGMPGELGRAAVSALGDVGKAGIGACADAVSYLSHIARDGAEAIANFAVATLGQVVDLGNTMAHAAVDGLKQVASFASHAADAAMNELSRLARQFANSLYGIAAIEAVEWIGHNVADKGKLAVDTLQKLGEDGYAGARDAVNRLADAGNSFAKGAKDVLDKLNPSHWFPW